MKTNAKKLISLLLVCLLTLGMVPAVAYAAGDAWDGTTLTEPAQADGVYQIGTGAELAWFAQNAAASGNAVLTDDIDLGNHTWTPMAKLSGSFDGQNHTVKNLNGSNGLFTSVIGASDASRAEVKDVVVEGTGIGSAKLGAIAGSPTGQTSAAASIRQPFPADRKSAVSWATTMRAEWNAPITWVP